MKFRVRNLSRSFDTNAYFGMIDDAQARAEQRRDELRAAGFPQRNGADAGEFAAIAGLVSAPRKVDVQETELEDTEIRQLIRSGKLEAGDLVSEDGAQWSTLAEHPSFYDLFDEDEAHGHTFPWIPVVIIGAIVIAVIVLSI